MAAIERFKSAQESPDAGFESALAEIRAGRKRGHWIWYVFPQLSGLGTSPMSQSFAIDGEQEAIEFLRDAELRARLLTISRAVADQLRTGSVSLVGLMGSQVDAQKLVSSLTLFGSVARKLHSIEGVGEYDALARIADDVLAAAASQGYPPCAYTRGFLARPGMG